MHDVVTPARPACASPGSDDGGGSGGSASVRGTGSSPCTRFHSPAEAADAVHAMRATLTALRQRMQEQQAATSAAERQRHPQQAGDGGGSGPDSPADSPASAAAGTIAEEELDALHTWVLVPACRPFPRPHCFACPPLCHHLAAPQPPACAGAHRRRILGLPRLLALGV